MCELVKILPARGTYLASDKNKNIRCNTYGKKSEQRSQYFKEES